MYYVTSRSGNSAINLAQCQFFRKIKENEKPVILFAFENYRLTWIYDNEANRDKEYEDLLAIVSENKNSENRVKAFYDGEYKGNIKVCTESNLPTPPISDKEFILARVEDTMDDYIGTKGTWTRLVS
jgi:hypothetical protein